MLTLDTLNVMLAVSEEGMVEEMILAYWPLRNWSFSLKSSAFKKRRDRRSPALAGGATQSAKRRHAFRRNSRKRLCVISKASFSLHHSHRATAANTGVASSSTFTICRTSEAVDGEQQYLYPCATHAFFATLAVKSDRADHHVKPATTGRRARAVAE
ncbi:protoheme IX farnesyltransferase [Salmonella enterica subsp. arizonae]|uniref:Protoheme IX farnesyltransferase n=1 Tax=Salmonella enterica subsp. arizonae TaxID=59203 RepID=A0A447RC47_SALER|nr:protoheme IX farnesyltransferase [Salmonella enterica subsp. arizonae]